MATHAAAEHQQNENMTIKASDIWDSKQTKLGKEEIEMLLEQAKPIEIQEARKLVAAFEKSVTRNQEMRLKYASTPEKFLESEMQLNDDLQGLFAIAAGDIAGLNLLIDPKFVESLGSALLHENEDIRDSAVELLNELTDAEEAADENLEEELSIKKKLVTAFANYGILSLVLQILVSHDHGKDKEDDVKRVVNGLGVVENFTGLIDTLSSDVAKDERFMKWLLDGISHERPFSAQKLYCVEILSILLQDGEEGNLILLRSDGMEIILRGLVPFRKRDPKDIEEQEFLENLFDCLCCLLTTTEGKKEFLKAEGVDLILSMFSQKLFSRMRAIKALSYSLSGKDSDVSKQICNQIIDEQTLKYVFSTFLQKHSKFYRKTYTKSYIESEEDEHILTIIHALLRNLDNSAPDFRLTRVLLKFEEPEKLEKLLEIHSTYLTQVNSARARTEHELLLLKKEADEEEVEEYKQLAYMQLLDDGLEIVQTTDLILLELYDSQEYNSSVKVKDAIMKCLKEKGMTKREVTTVLEEYLAHMSPKDEQRKDLLVKLNRWDPEFLKVE